MIYYLGKCTEIALYVFILTLIGIVAVFMHRGKFTALPFIIYYIGKCAEISLYVFTLTLIGIVAVFMHRGNGVLSITVCCRVM